MVCACTCVLLSVKHVAHARRNWTVFACMCVLLSVMHVVHVCRNWAVFVCMCVLLSVMHVVHARRNWTVFACMCVLLSAIHVVHARRNCTVFVCMCVCVCVSNQHCGKAYLVCLCDFSAPLAQCPGFVAGDDAEGKVVVDFFVAIYQHWIILAPEHLRLEASQLQCHSFIRRKLVQLLSESNLKK